jgi:hypothetical protein
MNEPLRSLAARTAVAAALCVLAAGCQMSPHTPGAAAVATAPAARAQVAVSAPAARVADETVRFFTEGGYRLVQRTPDRLTFEQPADPALAQLVLGPRASGTTTALILVDLGEARGRTRVSAGMVLLTSAQGSVPVTEGAVVAELQTALGLVKTEAEGA